MRAVGEPMTSIRIGAIRPRRTSERIALRCRRRVASDGETYTVQVSHATRIIDAGQNLALNRTERADGHAHDFRPDHVIP
jgi:hypothetical protein